MNPVTTKQAFYRRYGCGEFGNTSIQWDTFEEWKASGYTGKIAIRTRTPGGRCEYLIPFNRVPSVYRSFLQHQSPSDCHFSAMIPDGKIIHQGEVSRLAEGLYFFGSEAPLPMRIALKAAPVHEYGIRAKERLEGADPDGWDWIKELLDNYPDHVVEFSTLSVPFGTVRGSRTIVWEVRKY